MLSSVFWWFFTQIVVFSAGGAVLEQHRGWGERGGTEVVVLVAMCARTGPAPGPPCPPVGTLAVCTQQMDTGTRPGTGPAAGPHTNPPVRAPRATGVTVPRTPTRPCRAPGALWSLLPGLMGTGTPLTAPGTPARPAWARLSPGLSPLRCKRTGRPRPRVQGRAPGWAPGRAPGPPVHGAPAASR